MSPAERKVLMQNVDKVCPDPAAYKRWYSFQLELLHIEPFQVRAHQISFVCDIRELALLDSRFSKVCLQTLKFLFERIQLEVFHVVRQGIPQFCCSIVEGPLAGRRLERWNI